MTEHFTHLLETLDRGEIERRERLFGRQAETATVGRTGGAVLQDASVAAVLGAADVRVRVRVGGLRHAHTHALLPPQHPGRPLLSGMY